MIYGWLYRSTVYRAFLRHRVWAWNRMLVIPFLAPFYLVSVPIVWFFLPQLVLIVLLIATSILFHVATVMDHVPTLQVAMLILFAPIMLHAALTLFTGYFPMSDAMVGNGSAAKKKLASAQQDLENWNI